MTQGGNDFCVVARHGGTQPIDAGTTCERPSVAAVRRAGRSPSPNDSELSQSVPDVTSVLRAWNCKIQFTKYATWSCAGQQSRGEGLPQLARVRISPTQWQRQDA
eukprot:10014-Eustigmatos_ZCMA.PRE.1